MRALNREQFLQMPDGILYAVGQPWCFGSIQVKRASLPNDWVYVDPCGIDSDSSDQNFERLFQMKEQGASYPMNTDTQRDGCYDKDAIFLVWEGADLARLRGMVDEAVAVCLEQDALLKQMAGQTPASG